MDLFKGTARNCEESLLAGGKEQWCRLQEEDEEEAMWCDAKGTQTSKLQLYELSTVIEITSITKIC